MDSLNQYIVHLMDYKVVICRLCQIGIPPDNSQAHYNCHHTDSKKFPISLEIRQQIVQHMSTLSLVAPTDVEITGNYIPELGVQWGWRCKYKDCNH